MKPLAACALGLALIWSNTAMSQPADARVVRIAELEIDPAQLDAYKAFLKEEIETSVRVEPGVLSLSAVAIKGEPSHLRILEVYADQAAYERHIQSPHFLKYKTGTADMVRALKLIETTPVAMCAKGGAC